jgi:hypothetical protein
MKISLINGSPKIGESCSGIILGYLKDLVKKGNSVKLYNINKALPTNKEYLEFCDSNVLVFAFPLYIDSIPSHLLSMLIELEQLLRNNKNDIYVYCIVVNGFYEGNQNYIAIDNMKHWCNKSGLIWGQAIGNGASEMIPMLKSIPLGHGPLKNLGRALTNLSENILDLESGETIFISPNWPIFLWEIQASTNMWHPRAKANGLKKKDLLLKR